MSETPLYDTTIVEVDGRVVTPQIIEEQRRRPAWNVRDAKVRLGQKRRKGDPK